MAYKEILVYLDPTAESLERLRFAIGLAKVHAARLIGVDVGAASGVEGAESSEVTRQTFESATGEAGLTAVLVPSEKPGEGEAFTHCVDLMVAPAPGGGARDVVRHGTLERALTELGAPMLILPRDWTTGTVGEAVVIAWNATREALRAVHDFHAVPRKGAEGDRLHLFVRDRATCAPRPRCWSTISHCTGSPRISPTGPTPATSRRLKRCSPASTPRTPISSSPAPSAIRALYESLFGGVSLDLMNQQSIPVLMSH